MWNTTCEKTKDEQEKEINLIKKVVDFEKQRMYPPERLMPQGLSVDRQWYLYEQIRQHIPNENDKDITCPKPTEPKKKEIF